MFWNNLYKAAKIPAKLAKYISNFLFPLQSRGFLYDCKGVVHVGANDGAERDVYSLAKLNVVWVEPLPDVFQELRKNIAHLPSQRCFNYLLTDKDNVEYDFHVASNKGASSSIFQFEKHTEVWPTVNFSHTLRLVSHTLAKMTEIEQIDLGSYDCLVIDAQGAELLILKGAQTLLHNFKYIYTEAADFESYKEGATLHQITEFLADQGFQLIRSQSFARKSGVGTYYDVLYKLTPRLTL